MIVSRDARFAGVSDHDGVVTVRLTLGVIRMDDEGLAQPAAGRGRVVLLALLAVLTVIVAVVLAFDSDDKRTPASGASRPRPTTPQPPPSTSTPAPVPSTEPPARSECEDEICISWSLARLLCTSDPCTPDITVRSEGAKALRILGLRLTGGAKDRLDTDAGDCLGASLQPGGSCTITVGLSPGRAGRAQLRIQQNLPTTSSVVDIEVGGPATPAADLDLSITAADLRCAILPEDPYWNADGLTILVQVLKTGTAKLPGVVPFRVASDTGRNRPGNATLSSDPKARTSMRIPLQRSDYDASHVYTLTVDPDDKIAELDETNNSLMVMLPPVDPPVTASDVPCWTV